MINKEDYKTINYQKRSGSAEKGERTRKKILLVADSLFKEKGFINTKMKDIAKVAQTSESNVSKHFRGGMKRILKEVKKLNEEL
jgi:AcrR family transcriptional regulator